MLSQIVFSSFILLAIASCCTARVYNFSQYKNVKPQSDIHIISSYKFLTYGDPCEPGPIDNNIKDQCRSSAHLECSDNKCVCSDQTVWDPKVEYLSPYEEDKDQHIIGMCAALKGKDCYIDITTPDRGGWQCVHDSACVVPPAGEFDEPCPPNPPDYCEKPGICQ